MRTQIPALLLLTFAAPAVGQVRINEILPDPGSEFDGAEFIELKNMGGAPVSIAGWVLTGTEFSGTCGGEDHWQFPAGATIAAGGFIVVAKDAKDTLSVDLPDDGFIQRFGFNPDFEMVDLSFGHDTDDPGIPNLALLTPQSFDDQIGLIPGSGYARTCTAFNQYEALYLYNGVPGGGGVLQDVIEYRDPVNCVADACLGVGSGDNDAFAGLPIVGQSLGRNAASGDTNNSSTDLFVGTPTPKAANIANPGPTLSTLTLNNPDPLVGESVTITIQATDANGIGTLHLVRSVNGGAADSVLMTNTIGSTYSGTIAAQADQAQVEYFVRARDGGSPAGVGVSKFPDEGKRKIRWGTQTIFQCQFHSPPSDAGKSVEVGKAVNIQGVVTTESGPYNTSTGNVVFTVQSGAGFWNGVHVFDPVGTSNVARGDSVRVAGEVQEFSGRTEIVIFGGENVTKLASGRPLPGPFAATCSQLTTGATFGELLEGVYTRLVNVQVTAPMDANREWEVSDATGTCIINDDAFYLYVPTLGDSLDVVQGIVDFSFTDRKLEPRDDLDIQGPPLVSTVRYSPIPPLSTSPITITATIVDNGTLPRRKLFYSTNNGATYDSTNMVLQAGTTYAATVGPYPNGTDLDYHVEVTDNDGFNGRSPSAGNYDLYVGVVTIQTVQSTVFAGSDSSQFENQPRNLAGIVTQAPGTIADNIFVIQNHWTTDPAFRGIHVYSGGSLVGQLELGDSVAVSGDVDEYFGLTEMRMHFTDAYHDYGQVGELQGFVLPTTSFLPDSTGALPAAESWEGVLLQFNGSIVTNASAGFGQYYIDNTAPTTGQETLVDDESRVSGLTYAPAASDARTFRGIGDFTFGQYKLQPRNDSDILPFNPANAVGVEIASGATLRFTLHQNAPNPAGGPGTRIAFSLPHREQATLRVFDVQGRLVRTLVKGQLEGGSHVVTWDGQNDKGQSVSTGVYFYRLTAGEDTATRKLTYLR